MVTEINEPIKVGVIFERQKIKPVWFIWQSRKFFIRSITYTWQEKIGETKINYFSVSDGHNLFEIGIENSGFNWTLFKVESND